MIKVHLKYFALVLCVTIAYSSAANAQSGKRSGVRGLQSGMIGQKGSTGTASARSGFSSNGLGSGNSGRNSVPRGTSILPGNSSGRSGSPSVTSGSKNWPSTVTNNGSRNNVGKGLLSPGSGSRIPSGPTKPGGSSFHSGQTKVGNLLNRVPGQKGLVPSPVSPAQPKPRSLPGANQFLPPIKGSVPKPINPPRLNSPGTIAPDKLSSWGVGKGTVIKPFPGKGIVVPGNPGKGMVMPGGIMPGGPGNGGPGNGGPGNGGPGNGGPGNGGPGNGGPGNGGPGNGGPGNGGPGNGSLHHHHCWPRWTGCFGGFHCPIVQPCLLPTVVVLDQPVTIIVEGALPVDQLAPPAIDLAVRGAILVKATPDEASRTLQILIENRGPTDLTTTTRVAVFAMRDGLNEGELPSVIANLEGLSVGMTATLEMTLPTSAIGCDQIIVAVETPVGFQELDETNNLAQGTIASLPVHELFGN